MGYDRADIEVRTSTRKEIELLAEEIAEIDKRMEKHTALENEMKTLKSRLKPLKNQRRTCGKSKRTDNGS